MRSISTYTISLYSTYVPIQTHVWLVQEVARCHIIAIYKTGGRKQQCCLFWFLGQFRWRWWECQGPRRWGRWGWPPGRGSSQEQTAGCRANQRILQVFSFVRTPLTHFPVNVTFLRICQLFPPVCPVPRDLTETPVDPEPDGDGNDPYGIEQEDAGRHKYLKHLNSVNRIDRWVSSLTVWQQDLCSL